MNTEQTFLYIVLIIYMALNLYTDLKYSKTKNFWHLTMILVFIFLSVLNKSLLLSLGMITGGFLVGIGLRKVTGGYGAGDIKMLMVLFAGFSLIGANSFKDFLIIVLAYMVVSLIHTSTFKLIQIKLKKDMKLGQYILKKGYIQVPEAVPLAITTLIIPITINGGF